jgi:hypothetical protein
MCEKEEFRGSSMDNHIFHETTTSLRENILKISDTKFVSTFPNKKEIGNSGKAGQIFKQIQDIGTIVW